MQVSGLQHPLVSARIQHALSETNSGFGPAPYAIGARGADGLQSADEGAREVKGALGEVLSAAGCSRHIPGIFAR
jgi:hypothetical protein